MPTSIHRLDTADLPTVTALLDADPVQNVYLRSELLLGGIRSGPWWGVVDGDRLRGVVLGGPLVVPWVPEPADAAVAAAEIDRRPPRMIVGPREQALRIHAARRPPARVREIRDPQPLMTLRRGVLAPVADGAPVRRSVPADLGLLTVAAAAMHREEMGIDPLAVDPAAWRARMAGLIDRGWSWLWTEGDEVVFKAELSAWTPEVAQVQGVYVAPARRNRGVGAAGLAVICADVLREVPLCSLYVNHFNHPALALYHRLGFEKVGDLATLIY